MPAQQTSANETSPVVASPAAAARWERAGGFIGDALRLAGVVAADVVTRRPVRLLADEAVRALPGDELVAEPKLRWQHAITIRARPADGSDRPGDCSSKCSGIRLTSRWNAGSFSTSSDEWRWQDDRASPAR